MQHSFTHLHLIVKTSLTIHFHLKAMKKLLTLTVAFLFALFATAQDRKAEASKSFSQTGFDRLSMGHAFRITVRPGSFKIVAEGDKDDIDELEASVSNGTLKIRFKDHDKSWWSRKNHHRVDITINMPAIKGVDFSGATSSTVEGFDNIDVFDVDISGASSSRISLSAKRINLDLSGASNITIIGKAKDLSGDISGATTFKGADLRVENAELEVSGASNAKISVSENLSADASGASSLRYIGNPRVKMNTSGASSVRSEK